MLSHNKTFEYTSIKTMLQALLLLNIKCVPTNFRVKVNISIALIQNKYFIFVLRQTFINTSKTLKPDPGHPLREGCQNKTLNPLASLTKMQFLWQLVLQGEII